MKTRFFVLLAIVIPVLAIFGCGEEEDVIQLLKTDPPYGGELGNIGTLTMTFDGEPTEVTIESPGGSRSAKITGKTATYTFTTDDSLVVGGKVPIGISWVSKGGSTGGKIVKFTIVAGGGRATGVSVGKIAFVSERDGNYEIYVMNPDGSNPTNITNTPEEDEYSPSWSPDGKAIVFNSHRRSGDDNNEIYKIAYDEANPLAATPVRLTFHGARDNDPSWGK